jgi:hypothetical protein
MDLAEVSIFPRGHYAPDRFGTVGDWFSGMLTLVAVLVAIQTFAAERARDSRERDEAQISEASKVFAWWDLRRELGKVEPILVLRNLLPQPVYHWKALVVCQGVTQQLTSDEFGQINPGERQLALPLVQPWISLLRSGTAQVTVEYQAPAGFWLRRNSTGDIARVEAAEPRHGGSHPT